MSVPCLVVEEGWHHRALIDWSYAWVPFAVAVSLAFLLGGAVAGAGARRGGWDALGRGLGAGLAAIACLVVADLVRRDVIVREPLSFGVVKLWLAAGAGAIALAALGGLGGWAVGPHRPAPPDRRRGPIAQARRASGLR